MLVRCRLTAGDVGLDAKQVSMMAVRHLAQVCEAYSACLRSGRLPATAVNEKCTRCARQIEQIAKDGIHSEVTQHDRMTRIAAAMLWLGELRLELEPHLKSLDLSAPSPDSIQLVRAAAMNLTQRQESDVVA